MIAKCISLVIANYARKLHVGKRGLIFTDNHKCHLALTNVKMINDLGFDTLFFPVNLTGELQPIENIK